MESLYFVLSWLCHRTCEHCYEDRFHPYHGEELKRVVNQSRQNVPIIIDHLPDRMSYADRNDRDSSGKPHEKTGRIILSGGEILLEPIREPVLYPALQKLHDRYRHQGGVELIVQTTGDLVNAKIVRELLDLHVSVISVSGLDEYHNGLEQVEDRDALQGKLTALFERHGMQPWRPPPRPQGPAYYHFFGATPDQWIGKLWPRGRAWQNELSTATVSDNFCNRWSGGLNFLESKYSGSEVSIDPEGNVYPCCIKTKKPIGSLLRNTLDEILASVAGASVYQAISMGQPERMGLTHGWSVEKFLEKSTVQLPSGRLYQNLCIGCDSFHDEVLSPLVIIGESNERIDSSGARTVTIAPISESA